MNDAGLVVAGITAVVAVVAVSVLAVHVKSLLDRVARLEFRANARPRVFGEEPAALDLMKREEYAPDAEFDDTGSQHWARNFHAPHAWSAWDDAK